MSTVGCPHCRNSVQYDFRLTGQAIVCPNCRGQFLVPGAPTPPPLPELAAIGPLDFLGQSQSDPIGASDGVGRIAATPFSVVVNG